MSAPPVGVNESRGPAPQPSTSSRKRLAALSRHIASMRSAPAPAPPAATTTALAAQHASQLQQIEAPPGAQTLAELMAAHGTPGLSVAVVKDFKFAWARGYGTATRGAAGMQVDTETLFQAASVSKSGATLPTAC